MVKGSSPLRSTIVPCGATVARLILVQKIVVRIHAGKPEIKNDFTPQTGKGNAMPNTENSVFMVLPAPSRG